MYTPITGTGSGSAPVVNLTWPFIDKSHVQARVNGVPVVATWTGAAQLTFASAVPNGTPYDVIRVTPYAAPLVDFSDGSVLTEEDLDLALTQLRYAFEEARVLGMGGDAALRSDLNQTTGSALIKTATGRSLEERLSTAVGEQKTITTTSGSSADRVGENIAATNSTGTGMYSVRFAFLNKTGEFGDNSNDIADTLISRYDNITFGQSWLHWDVTQSPLNPASGLPGAPTSPQRFAMVIGEGNPQNRWGESGWNGEARLFQNWVGGYQMAPDTTDFSALLGGERVGYHASFAWMANKSPFTNTLNNRHAGFYNVLFTNPNAVAPGGYFAFSSGYMAFPTDVAVVAGGSGYSVGDVLTFNTGLSTSSNENTEVEVLAVDGTGSVTGARLYRSGWYQQPFASTVGVTGGSGAGATFSYTLSAPDEAPQAFIGMAGQWHYGIDAVPPPGSNSNMGDAHYLGAMIRAANDETILVARDAAGANDVTILKLNASDEIELGQAGTMLTLLGQVAMGLSDFTDDTTAATGGIAIGQLYRTGNAVKVRIA